MAVVDDAPYSHIVVSPVAGSLRAEISGVDLSRPEEDVVEEIRRASSPTFLLPGAGSCP